MKTFKNQLNSAEIYSGLLLYITKEFWIFSPVLALFFGLLRPFDLGTRDFSMLAWSIIGAALGVILPILVLRSFFSTEKIATYTLNERRLQVINNDGTVHDFLVDKIKKVEDQKVYVLIFEGRHFAIIAKRNLDPITREYLESVIKDRRKK